MCDTAGFISPAQYGKEIKCCNPGCRMPIYKAPPAPIVKTEEVKPSGLTTPMLSLIGIAGLGIVGGAVWYFVLREEPQPVVNQPTPVNPVGPVDDKPPEKIENVPIAVKVAPPATLPEMRTQSLKAIAEAAQKRDGVRNKTLARELAADAYLLAGMNAEATEQITRLLAIDKNTTFYAVTPFAMQAEAASTAGDTAARDAALEQALDVVTKLPDVGRQPLDSMAILAAALVRAERIDEARKLVGRYAQGDSRSRTMMSALWRGGLDGGTFDFEAMEDLPHHEFSGNSLWMTTTQHLCSHGQWDHALTWIKAAPDVMTADACSAAWATIRTRHLVRHPDPAGETALAAAIEAATPAARIRMSVASAIVRLQSGDRAAAEKGRDAVTALVNALTAPTASVPPFMKAIHDSKGRPFAGLPDPRPGKSLALAVADLAFLQMQLGDLPGSWTTLEQSLDRLRSVAPGPLAVQRLLTQCEENSTIVKSLLENDLKLEPQETKRIAAFNQYRAQCQVLLKESQERFAIQESLLVRAARAGLAKEVWEHVMSRNTGEIDTLEPYRLESQVPLAVWLGANTYGQTDMFKTINAAYDKNKRPKAETFPSDPLLLALGKIEAATRKPKADAAASTVTEIKGLYSQRGYDRQKIDRLVLSLISRLGKTDLAMAFDYARRLPDPPIREDALRMLAGWAVVHGKGPDFWKMLDAPNAKDLQPLDREALYLGLIEGIQVTEGRP